MKKKQEGLFPMKKILLPLKFPFWVFILALFPFPKKIRAAEIFSMQRREQNDSMILVLENVIREGLDFIAANQIKTTIEGRQYAGEWPVSMEMQNGFFLLGGRKKVEDSNCFSVASTHNLLAKIYLADKKYSNIPDMLNEAFPRIIQYQNGYRFNFWNALPPNKKLFRGDTLYPKVRVRRPTNFKLRSKYINKAANVVEDADDTGLAYTAIFLQKKIRPANNLNDSLKLPPSIAGIFDPYRDLNRKNRHWYNYINESGDEDNSGAYLTWHAKEYEFKKWDITKVVFHNATFYLPFSECYPFAYRPYMPYGSNDIDAVVNANVIATLALYNEKSARGYNDAVAYLIKKCRTKRYNRIATYYPNPFQFTFSLANAYSLGAAELEECRATVNEYLLKRQNDDGSWKSPVYINRGDKIQSTANAINALLLFNQNDLNPVRKQIENGIAYLLTNCKKQNGQSHWKGGVLFSGGTVVRTSLFWKSDAYTTALILHAFVLYKKILLNPGQKN